MVERRDGTGPGTRTVKLRLYASCWITFIELPREPLVGWSMDDPLPLPIAGQTTITARVVAPNPAGQDPTLPRTRSAPVKVKVKVLQVHTSDKAPEFLDLRRRMPAWTTLNARVMHLVKVAL